MGEKLLGYGPQGMALEVNPWQTKSSVEAVLLYRGAIVSGWANVETTLIEIAIRASRHNSYAGYRDSYPYKLKGRIAYLNGILKMPGPLHAFSNLGEAVLKRYAESADIRNMMAHARMSLLPGWGATFYFFQPKSDKEISYQTRRVTQAQLEALARRVTRFSRAVRMLAAQLERRKLLPPLEDGVA